MATRVRRRRRKPHHPIWHKVAIPLNTDIPGGTEACFVSQKCAVFFHIPGFMKGFREKIKEKKVENFDSNENYTESYYNLYNELVG